MMNTANQISLGVILGFVANALYWWVIQPAWYWFIDRLLPVQPLCYLGADIARVHMYGVVDEP